MIGICARRSSILHAMSRLPKGTSVQHVNSCQMTGRPRVAPLSARDTSLAPERSVRYRTERPVLEANAVRRNCYLAKSKHWEYENEDRLVRSSPGTRRQVAGAVPGFADPFRNVGRECGRRDAREGCADSQCEPSPCAREGLPGRIARRRIQGYPVPAVPMTYGI